jgi:hypothetical protein
MASPCGGRTLKAVIDVAFLQSPQCPEVADENALTKALNGRPSQASK